MDFWHFSRGPASVLLLVEFGQARHIEPVKLLKGAQLTMAQLADPDCTLQAWQELEVASNLLRLSGQDAGLGLQVGMAYRLSTYGLLGYGMLSSATGIEAIGLANRFLALTYSYSQITYRRVGVHDQVVFEPSPDLSPALQRFFVERAIGATCRVLRDVLGSEFQLSALELTYRDGSTTASRMPQRILGAALRYGQKANLMSFEHQYLERPLPQANPVTATMCERMCMELLGRRRTRLDTVAFVREYLSSRSFSKPPQLKDLAKLLNTSERTLKRRLQDEGANFRTLTNAVRQAKAEALVAEGQLSLTEIADSLGFSDLSTFSQAFKRWTGESPSAARKHGV